MRIPHVWLLPIVIVVNCPVGMVLSVLLPPQQVMVLLVRIPHECISPVVMEVNCPVGGCVNQQATVLSVRIPHDLVMVVNIPIDGGVVWPYQLSPQQVIVLLVRIPHE